MRPFASKARKTGFVGDGPCDLPPAPRAMYMDNVQPSIGHVRRQPNLEWLNHELGTLGVAPSRTTDMANELLRGRPNDKDVNKFILAVATALLARTPWPEDDALLVEAFYTTSTGVGFALLEQLSGQQEEGLVHPSIWNGMCYSDMLDKWRHDFPREKRQVATIGRRGGYFAFRRLEVRPEAVFSLCTFD